MKFIVFILLFFSTYTFANSVGTVSAIIGKAQIQRGAKLIDASLQQQLKEHDIILTKKMSRLQIVFTDGAIITLGQNSNFVIQKYNYKENKSSLAHFFLQKGTMRASTGKIGKLFPQNFIVKTKNMKIGVMGTDFTISISQDGVQKAYCTYGTISVETDSKSFKIPAGIYITRQIDATRDIANIPKEHYQDILLKVQKDKTTNTKEEVDKSKTNLKKKLDTKVKLEVEEDKSSISLNEGENIDIDIVDFDSSNNNYISITTDISDNITTYVKDDSTTDTQTLSLVGRSTKRVNLMIEQSVNLNILTDSASTTMLNSTINLTRNNWWFKYTLSETPTNFNSLNDFQTTIVHAQSGTGRPLPITSSSFYTQTDLKSDDSMTWGYWNVVHPNENGAIGGGNSGYWVAGIQTDPNVIASYNSNTSYTGIYKAMNYTKSNTYTGTAQLNIDFGADNTSALLSIEQLNGTDYSYNMDFNGRTTLNGTQVNGIGSASAIFYGPSGSSAGGNFIVSDGNRDDNLMGVFQVTATTTPQ